MKLILAILVMLAAAASCQQSYPGCRVFRKASNSKAPIQREIQRFLGAIGGQDNGNEPGAQRRGFRSVNWDAAIVPFLFPSQFFNLEVPRGFVYTSNRCEMAVSNPDDERNFGNGDNLLDTFDPANARNFRAFSPERIFCPFDDPQFDVTVFVPGKVPPARATTRAFGVVALDVDKGEGAKVAVFKRGGKRILRRKFKPQPLKNKGFSFFGVVCNKPVIDRVQVVLGKKLFDSCVDDVFIGEPVPY